MDLTSPFVNIAQPYTLMEILANIILAFVLALAIAKVYKMTHRGLSYSQSMMLSLVLMGTITSVMMMVIGNSLAKAVGLLGAFSIIRFRTAVKDTKDTAYLFFALGSGLAAGTGNYLIAVTGTIMICLIALILHKFNFGSMKKYDYILTFEIDSKQTSEESYKSIFGRYMKQSTLLNINSLEDGKMELVFDIKLIHDKENRNMVAELNSTEGIKNTRLITSKHDIEY